MNSFILYVALTQRVLDLTLDLMTLVIIIGSYLCSVYMLCWTKVGVWMDCVGVFLGGGGWGLWGSDIQRNIDKLLSGKSYLNIFLFYPRW